MRALGIRFILLFSVAVLFGAATLTASAAQSSKKSETSSKDAASSADSGTKVDLNTASEKQLDSLPGVGSATAKKIVAGRPYSSVDDLSKAGVSASTVKKITPLVTVSGGSAAAAPTVKPSTPVSERSPARSESAPAAPAKAVGSSASQGTPGPGMVWVNLESGVYHYQSSRFYGKTKSGKYMSEADAVKAGYHPAKNEKKPQ